MLEDAGSGHTNLVVLGDYENALAPLLSERLVDVSVRSYTDSLRDEETLIERLAEADIAVVI